MRVLAGCDTHKVSLQTRKLMLKGCVGEAAYLVFTKWAASLELPTPHEVIDLGRWTPNPERPDIASVVISNCFSYVCDERFRTPARIKAIWDLYLACLKVGLGDAIKNRVNMLMDQKIFSNTDRTYITVLKELGEYERHFRSEEA